MSTVTAAPIRVQAREIVRYAKRHGLALVRYGTGFNNRHCARSVIRHAVKPEVSMYLEEINEAVGLTYEEMESLEQGFDYGNDPRNENAAPSLKYFKIGQNIARLAGLA